MEWFKKSNSGVLERFAFLQSDDSHRLSIHPYQDWFVLVVTSGIVGIILILMAGCLFLFVNGNGSIIAKDSTIFPNSLNQQNLERALSIFKTKEDALNTLFNVPPRIIDPSL